MDRQADGPRLVDQRPLNGLAYPPGGICGKTTLLGQREALNRFDQSQVASSDQIKEGEPRLL